MDRENTMMEERQVSLWDLMVEILSHWRVLLIAMLIGGISFGGFSYVRSIQNVNTQRALLNEQEEKGAVSVLEEKLSKEQKTACPPQFCIEDCTKKNWHIGRIQL